VFEKRVAELADFDPESIDPGDASVTAIINDEEGAT
jgi:hypothetical protein